MYWAVSKPGYCQAASCLFLSATVFRHRGRQYKRHASWHGRSETEALQNGQWRSSILEYRGESESAVGKNYYSSSQGIISHLFHFCSTLLLLGEKQCFP